MSTAPADAHRPWSPSEGPRATRHTTSPLPETDDIRPDHAHAILGMSRMSSGRLSTVHDICRTLCEIGNVPDDILDIRGMTSASVGCHDIRKTALGCHES